MIDERAALIERHPDIDGTVAIEPFKPTRCNAAHASLNAVDADVFAANVGPGAKLVLPNAVADNGSSFERKVEHTGNIRRQGGDGHDRRLAGQADRARRNTRGAEPLELVKVAAERQIVSIGERPRFAMRVLPEYRDDAVH